MLFAYHACIVVLCDDFSLHFNQSLMIAPTNEEIKISLYLQYLLFTGKGKAIMSNFWQK